MLQAPGSVDPVQIEMSDPSDAAKFVPGALLRVTGKHKVPPGQQKRKHFKADGVHVLAGGRGRGLGLGNNVDSEDNESGSGGDSVPGKPMPLSNKPQAPATAVGTVQQLPVKLAQMKLLVVPSKPRSAAAVSRLSCPPPPCLPHGQGMGACMHTAANVAPPAASHVALALTAALCVPAHPPAPSRSQGERVPRGREHPQPCLPQKRPGLHGH